MERLDKILSDAGVASRKELKKIISSGLVTVNGVPVTDSSSKFDRGSISVLYQGNPVNTEKYRYFAICKPSGVLTATEDSRQQTVLDLLPEELKRLGLFPVGRLDKDTTGLLLLTNDGTFAHRVISPACHVDKRYIADVERSPEENAESRFESGLVLADGTECEPGFLERLSELKCAVTVHEGKFHQVKRMLAAVGAPVISLRRVSIGALLLEERRRDGEWWELSLKERELVFSNINKCDK